MLEERNGSDPTERQPLGNGLRAVLAVGALVSTIALLWLLWSTPDGAVPAGPDRAETPPSAPGGEANSAPRAAVDGRQDSSKTPLLAATVRASPHGEEAETGSLHLLSPGTLTPASGTAWRVIAEGEEATILLDVDGRSAVPPGTWSLIPLTPDWNPPAAPVVVTAGTDQVVWVERSVEREFRVLRRDGTPIEGVVAVWSARETRTIGGARAEKGQASRVSDDSGLVTFESGPYENGEVTFLHPAYARVHLSLCGEPEALVDVRMRASSGGRRLRFAASRTGTPLESVTLRSTDGLVLARSEVRPDELELPAWVPPDETLRVTAPGMFPCQFRLKDISQDTLVLPVQVKAELTCVDPSMCESGSMVSIRPTGAGMLRELEPLIGGETRACTGGEVMRFDLPDGYEFEARAWNGCGSTAAERFVAGDAASQIRLVLGPSGHLELTVLDEAGAGLTSASAKVLGQGAFPADGSGTVRVPTGPRTRTVHVSAPGYCPTTLGRSGTEAVSPETVDRLSISLAPETRAGVRVLSSSGEPLRGMRVRIWPSSSDPRPASDGSWTEQGISVAAEGTTGGQGLCNFTGLRAGGARIEVDLPPVLGTDAWRRIAYPPVRVEERLEDEITVEVRVPEPVQLTLEVLDGSTGMPVPGFSLHGQAATVPTVEVAGGYWQGWVSSSVHRYRVVVPGLGSAEFGAEPPWRVERRVIRVGATGSTTLRVMDLPESTAGTPLTIQILEESPDGLHGVASLEATLDATGQALLDLGLWQASWIAIAPLGSGESRLRFEPEVQRIAIGGQIEFRAVGTRE